MQCQSVKDIRSAIDTLNGQCSFWACNGPDAPFVSMETCSICATIQDLREVLKREASE